MTNKKILLLFPLFYSSFSLYRLQKYLELNKYKCDISVWVFCSNDRISAESNEICRALNFVFLNRDNFGGGEGSLLLLSRDYHSLAETFDFVVYLEESCEPIHSAWLVRLIHDLETGSLITGWHWNWRAKKRSESTSIKIGSGMHIARSYVNSKNSLPFETYMVDNVLDTPGFRHECIAFRPNLLEKLIFSEKEIQEWRNIQPKSFGLAMELFSWKAKKESDLRSPNFQYSALLRQRKLPFFIPMNYRFFRELSMSERSKQGFVPYEMNFMRNFLLSYARFFHILWKNSVKFFFVGLLEFEVLSKYRNDL